VIASQARARLPFRSVNRADAPGYQPGLQRHHLLPCQALGRRSFAAFLAVIGPERIGFDDFRHNGLLLPANDTAAVRLGLPLHRGPHRTYNELVFDRLGSIEATWSGSRLRFPEAATVDALARIALLQAALRRRLLAERRPFRLNRRDRPLPQDFAMLDAMAAQLWTATGA
jgi:A nuclease family of the HNH/ENDO VII superfamily with conserved AHH